MNKEERWDVLDRLYNKLFRFNPYLISEDRKELEIIDLEQDLYLEKISIYMAFKPISKLGLKTLRKELNKKFFRHPKLVSKLKMVRTASKVTLRLRMDSMHDSSNISVEFTPLPFVLRNTVSNKEGI